MAFCFAAFCTIPGFFGGYLDSLSLGLGVELDEAGGLAPLRS
jgi:hypothetical protein